MTGVSPGGELMLLVPCTKPLMGCYSVVPSREAGDNVAKYNFLVIYARFGHDFSYTNH